MIRIDKIRIFYLIPVSIVDLSVLSSTTVKLFSYAPVFGEEAPVEAVEEKQDEPQEKAYTVEEVAQILGCSERNVYRNIQSGKLEAVEREVMIPTLKKFVTEEALEKYKAGRAS